MSQLFDHLVGPREQRGRERCRERDINVVDIKPDRDKRSRLISQIDLFTLVVLTLIDTTDSSRLIFHC